MVGTNLDHSFDFVSFILLKVLLKAEVILIFFPSSYLVLLLCDHTWDRPLSCFEK